LTHYPTKIPLLPTTPQAAPVEGQSIMLNTIETIQLYRQHVKLRTEAGDRLCLSAASPW
jgi:hypothetical protein